MLSREWKTYLAFTWIFIVIYRCLTHCFFLHHLRLFGVILHLPKVHPLQLFLLRACEQCLYFLSTDNFVVFSRSWQTTASWAKSGMRPVFVWPHVKHGFCIFTALIKKKKTMGQRPGPAKSKTFTIWPFTESLPTSGHILYWQWLSPST